MPERSRVDRSSAQPAPGAACRPWCRCRRSARAPVPRGLADGRRNPSLVSWQAATFAGNRVSANGNTLLALSSQPGSKADLIRRCWSSSCALNCTGIRSRFSTPTPCSPVRQPPTSTHSFRMSAPNCSALWKLTGSLASNMISGCRLPSPAWKMLATFRAIIVGHLAECGAARQAGAMVGITPSMHR